MSKWIDPIELIFDIVVQYPGMAIDLNFKDSSFGVGDRVKVAQKIKEGEKTRTSIFEGIVLAIKGRAENKMVTVRRVGAANIGIERIFPMSSPTIQGVEVTRKGKRGVRSAKIYYVRNKTKREIESIYSKSLKREKAKTEPQVKVIKKAKRKSK